VEACNGRGAVYRFKGQYDRAIADIDVVVRAQPGNATALSNRGIAYRMKGDHDRAIADFGEAIRLAPRDAQLYYSRGLAYEGKGDREKAIADYRRQALPLPALAPSLPGAERAGARPAARRVSAALRGDRGVLRGDHRAVGFRPAAARLHAGQLGAAGSG
jgi:tetratricopeptide (TPR) repeat protein